MALEGFPEGMLDRPNSGFRKNRRGIPEKRQNSGTPLRRARTRYNGLEMART